MEFDEKKFQSFMKSIVNPIIDKMNEAVKDDLKTSRKEFDDRLKKSRKEFEKIIKELSKQIGWIGDSNGDYAEEFFLNSLNKSMKIGEMKFEFIDNNCRRHIKSKNIMCEYDIILTNSDSIVVVEIKYRLTREYVSDFYHKKLKKFRELFPLYKNFKLFGAVASFSDYDKARQLSQEYGLFVLGRSGEQIELINDNAREYN